MRFYECVTAKFGINWGVENGYVAPPNQLVLAQLSELDLSKIKIVGGDYKQTELQKQLNKEANLHRLCLITKEHMGKATVVFTASVSAAKGVTHYLVNNYGIRAGYVHGKQDSEERSQVINDYKHGDIDVLVNVAVCATGFDAPRTDTLILGRPTRSRAFWLQCVGRATRPLPGVVDVAGLTKEKRIERIAQSDKPFFTIVDCTDASLDHKLVTSVDMFCDLTDDERKAARKICSESETPLTPDEIEEAAILEAEKIAAAQAIEAMRKQSQGIASGTIHSAKHTLGEDGKRCVGTYRNPLKGKYAGRTLNELPGNYLEWGAANRKLTSWIRNLYLKELRRRDAKNLERYKNKYASRYS
jgi:superfamily II DNA or RNA helicase